METNNTLSSALATADLDAQCPDHGCARWRCDEEHDASADDSGEYPDRYQPDPAYARWMQRVARGGK